jgi:glutamate 5-kinase
MWCGLAISVLNTCPTVVREMRVVVKIGTSSLTDDAGRINHSMIASLVEQVTQLRSAGHEVLVVTSGAVAAGVAAMGMDTRPNDLPTLQAVAAVGQSRLMESYNDLFRAQSVVAAQVLVVAHDFVDRRQYLHCRQTLTRLLELGCVPVINENDAIASDEIRYGDNDKIAALVSHNIGADLLVLLTDIDGLYTADPRSDSTAQLVSRVAANDPRLAVSAGAAGTARGSGGMASKLAAARIASWSGVRTVIARATRESVLASAVSDSVIGTTFEAHDRALTARKLWIAFAADSQGAITVDDGAANAVRTRGTSLLHAGVSAVSGSFLAGDVVDILEGSGSLIARGVAGVDADVAARSAGQRSDALGDEVPSEIVHRDDLVVMPSQ